MARLVVPVAMAARLVVPVAMEVAARAVLKAVVTRDLFFVPRCSQAKAAPSELVKQPPTGLRRYSGASGGALNYSVLAPRARCRFRPQERRAELAWSAAPPRPPASARHLRYPTELSASASTALAIENLLLALLSRPEVRLVSCGLLLCRPTANLQGGDSESVSSAPTAAAHDFLSTTVLIGPGSTA